MNAVVSEDLQPGEEWRRRPSVIRQGVRFGVITFVACLTFAVLAAALAIAILAVVDPHFHR